jgi:uncharacterized membrane protein
VSLENKSRRRLNEPEDKMMARFTMYSLLFAVQGALALGGFGAVDNPRTDNPGIITIDAPGAGTLPGQPLGQGTFPYQVNNRGEIGGNYQDASNVLHGFLRTREGAFISFDAPGAGTGAVQGTQGFAISPEGTVVGKIIDANFVQHGMLRTREGAVTVFDAPSVGNNPPLYTIATCVNAEGTIAGNYADANGLNHAFLRTPDGLVAAVDPPGTGTAPTQGSSVSVPGCINDEGAIVGFYFDKKNVVHGFLRSADGAYTAPIDVVTAGTGAFQGTAALGTNEEGTIVGGYTDANNLNHGYVRARDGTITTFDVPAAGTLAGQGTIITTATINAGGVVTGNYLDENNVSHGFVRDEDGTITTFDAPGAGMVAGLGGTTPIGNNARDWVTGYYFDANGVGHGFLRTGRGRH